MIALLLASLLGGGDPQPVPTPAASGSVTPDLVAQGERAWLSWTETVEGGHRLRLAPLTHRGVVPCSHAVWVSSCSRTDARLPTPVKLSLS